MSGRSGAMLQMRQLTKRYPGGDLALNGVNLEVPRG
ncbi:MAG: ABC transporter ATP-binding protein, partial [Deltaproteobacteria bacterium]|nr:ABC transporter ATP-binding protein [Deltaproteobacteria bacterium]